MARDVPVAPLVTLRVGGIARYAVEPKTPEELKECVQWALEQQVEYRVVGRGSNLLPRDGLLNLLVISLRRFDRSMVVGGDDKIRVRAGAPMPLIASRAASAGLAGFTFLGGIPGTIGGGVAMNAGVRRGSPREVGDVFEDAVVLDSSLAFVKLTRSDVKFEYRSAQVTTGEGVVVEVGMRAKGWEAPSSLRAALAEHVRDRARRQPLATANCGSVFKAPVDGGPAGWYLDQAGMKGVRIGGAAVSRKHANWIINVGNASATDVRRLIDVMRRAVEREFGLVLELELCMI